MAEKATEPGMGAIITEHGVSFRVWAPNAREVFVTGTFSNWDNNKYKLDSENNGFWSIHIKEAKIGDEYRFNINGVNGFVLKNDPYARELTSSVGNSVITDPHYDWGNATFTMPSWNKLVIYELHVGTFNVKEKGKPGTFNSVIEKLSYLKTLGINAIEIMPPTEFPGGFSWGYNPSHPFALEKDYGGLISFKDLVKAAHEHEIAIIVDVVYNHFGPSDLDLWQFDGWSQDNHGGIYFYQDWKRTTPWGENRPDYGRPEVRQYIRDNALMWLDEYKIDGLRTDAIAFIRNVEGQDDPTKDIPEGWSLMKWLNEEVRERFPWKIMIAEDLHGNEWITKDPGAGGQGFNSQWDPMFSHPVREVLKTFNDQDRDMHKISDALTHSFNGDSFQRVIYTESHDQVANGASRLPEEIMPGNATAWFPKKKSTLGAGLVFTTPGVPMIFQGQELLEDKYFSDTDPIDWGRFTDFKGLVRLYKDLINLRLNKEGLTRGLSGQHIQIYHVNHNDKVIAFQRWDQGGSKDTTIVVLNFANCKHQNYNIGLPGSGLWKIRLNSDWKGYDPEFADEYAYDTEASNQPKDGLPYNGNIGIGPYAFLILSQD